MHVGNLERTSVHRNSGPTIASSEVKISQQPPLVPSHQGVVGSNPGHGGHLPTVSAMSESAASVFTSSSTVKEETTVQGTSQVIKNFRGN